MEPYPGARFHSRNRRVIGISILLDRMTELEQAAASYVSCTGSQTIEATEGRDKCAKKEIMGTWKGSERTLVTILLSLPST